MRPPARRTGAVMTSRSWVRVISETITRVERLDETIRTVRKRANPRLSFDKIVLSRRRGTAEHNFRETELREGYGDLVARTIIPELATRQDAYSARTPIHQFRGGRAISLQTAYSDLLAELSLTTGGAS